MPSVTQTWAEELEDTAAQRHDLGWFRREFYLWLAAWADALFELTDAVLCADGPVHSLVDLTLVAEHRRGHGAMYDALKHGRIEQQRVRRTLASGPLPRTADGRIVLAVDVSPWLLWVPEMLLTSCDLLVLVEQSAEPVVPSDGVRLVRRRLGEWS